MSEPSFVPPDSGAPAVTLSKVTRTYPGGITALADADVAIDPGAAVGLIGPNGSGKSTLLAVIAGRLAPTAGALTVLGLDPTRRRDRRALRRRLSLLTQELALDGEMTGRETLALFAALHGMTRRACRERVAALTTGWGLEEHLDRRVRGYSGGLKRRLHLAAGAVHQPDLLLLDEPTAGLDPGGRGLVWSHVAAHRDRGGTVLVATHDLDDAERHCNLVVLLHRGRVAMSGPPRQLVAAAGVPHLTAVYEQVVGEPPPAEERR